MSITINGSGSITGLASGGLPDGSVTAADIESSLDLSGKTVTLPSGTGGKVLQVVQHSVETQTSASTSTWVATPLSVSITPSSTSSKVVVMLTALVDSEASGRQAVGTIFRDSINLGDASGGFGRTYGSASRLSEVHHYSYLDSPSTTSSTTYNFRIANRADNGAITTGSTVYVSNIIVMEIAG